MGLLWTTINRHEVAPAYPQHVKVEGLRDEQAIDRAVSMMRACVRRVGVGELKVCGFMVPFSIVEAGPARMNVRCTIFVGDQRNPVEIEITDDEIERSAAETSERIRDKIAAAVAGEIVMEAITKTLDRQSPPPRAGEGRL